MTFLAFTRSMNNSVHWAKRKSDMKNQERKEELTMRNLLYSSNMKQFLLCKNKMPLKLHQSLTSICLKRGLITHPVVPLITLIPISF